LLPTSPEIGYYSCMRTKPGPASRASLEIIRPKPAGHQPHPVFDPPPPPDHLGKPEQLIWRGVLVDYELPTGASIAVLASALEAHMRARECRETIEREGMTIVGRDGQTKSHPLLAVERDARAAWLAGIRALGLEL
jgi:P27 family predicted phage terminase small subunit